MTHSEKLDKATELLRQAVLLTNQVGKDKEQKTITEYIKRDIANARSKINDFKTIL